MAGPLVLMNAFEVPAAATQSPGFRDSAAGLAGYRAHPALYRIVRT
jgi:hypothetical protein